MKKLSFMVLTIAVAAFVQAAGLSIEKARAQIDKAIASPKDMQQLVSQLAPADQVKFLGEVNQAIAKMPGSAEERTAAFISVNRAAFRGAAKGNLVKLVAECYATVSVVALPVMNEQLSKYVFNRAANPSITYTDEQFIKIAESTMKAVNARLQSVDGSGVRAGFAALMFIRASNSQSEAVVNAMVAALPESVRKTAKDEWFPQALAEGESKNYDAMLLTVDGDVALTRDEGYSLSVTGPQLMDALLSDLSGDNTNMSLTSAATNPMVDAVTSSINRDLPTGMDAISDAGSVVTPRPDSENVEPGPYQYQTTGGSW